MEKFQSKDVDLAGRIRGCIVDSAPVAVPDPQVDIVTIFGTYYIPPLISLSLLTYLNCIYRFLLLAFLLLS